MLALEQNSGTVTTPSHKEQAMQAVEVPQSVPQIGTDNSPVPQVPAPEKAANEEDYSNSQLIRNITAFGDCV